MLIRHEGSDPCTDDLGAMLIIAVALIVVGVLGISYALGIPLPAFLFK